MQQTPEPAIRVSGLGKTYRIGLSGDRPTTAVEAALRKMRNPVRKGSHKLFDALDDLTFDVPWGEAMGIIGRNGAGKSTLLKVLTRITAPSRGRIELNGRIGSLLEVGTGFHPELTGRENIYLNGSLLGMSRKEIQRRFDEIVEFAGVATFLDTPVKRYSSGMYVRLAFSVAAHLETEILAIDEVLAVGDAEFQAKSLAKMRDVAKDGRTVLFVSHQAQTVAALCTSAVFLDRGRLAYHGPVGGAFDLYRESFEKFSVEQKDPSRRPGTGELRASSVEMGEDHFDPASEKTIHIALAANSAMIGKYFVSCHINDLNGSVLVQCDSRVVGGWYDPAIAQDVTLTVRTPWLKPGRYTVDVYVCKNGVLDAWEGAAGFEVLPHNPYPELAGDESLTRGLVLADFDFKNG